MPTFGVKPESGKGWEKDQRGGRKPINAGKMILKDYLKWDSTERGKCHKRKKGKETGLFVLIEPTVSTA